MLQRFGCTSLSRLRNAINLSQWRQGKSTRFKSTDNGSGEAGTRYKLKLTGFANVKPESESNFQAFGQPHSYGVSLAFALTFGSLAVLTDTVPHCQLLSKIPNYLGHFDGNGFPAKFSDKLEALIKEVMAVVKLTSEELKETKAYVCRPSDMMSWGLYAMNTGFLLGVPYIFEYQDVSEVDFKKFNFRGKHLPLVPDEEQEKAINELKETFVLPIEAKKFAIARDLIYGRENTIVTTGATKGIAAISTYLLVKLINWQFNLFAKPKAIRITSAMTCVLFMTTVTLMVTDEIRMKGDLRCDRLAAKISPEFSQGGVEYYNIMMKRNRLLAFLYPESEYIIDRRGDVKNGLLRTKQTPLTLRKKQCEQHM